MPPCIYFYVASIFLLCLRPFVFLYVGMFGCDPTFPIFFIFSLLSRHTTLVRFLRPFLLFFSFFLIFLHLSMSTSSLSLPNLFSLSLCLFLCLSVCLCLCLSRSLPLSYKHGGIFTVFLDTPQINNNIATHFRQHDDIDS